MVSWFPITTIEIGPTLHVAQGGCLATCTAPSHLRTSGRATMRARCSPTTARYGTMSAAMLQIVFTDLLHVVMHPRVKQ
jgi:hypothetical protein